MDTINNLPEAGSGTTIETCTVTNGVHQWSVWYNDSDGKYIKEASLSAGDSIVVAKNTIILAKVHTSLEIDLSVSGNAETILNELGYDTIAFVALGIVKSNSDIMSYKSISQTYNAQIGQQNTLSHEAIDKVDT